MLYNQIMTQKYPFQDRNALITGSGLRLGKAFALGLAKHGCNVIIHYGQSKQAAQNTAAEAAEFGVRAVTLQADLSDTDQTRRLFQQSLEALGDLDLLINNASIFDSLDWQQTNLEDWHRHFQVNLTAPFLLSQALGKHLSGRSGDILNMLDWRALRPGPDHFPYTITKSGLAALTQSLAQALGPSIRVNAIAPGAILPPPGVEEKEPEPIENVPADRWGEVDEVVQAMLFLMGGPGYITGEILHLDGGRHLI
jgi:pteridine reductase